jgi:hypothetical protein
MTNDLKQELAAIDALEDVARKLGREWNDWTHAEIDRLGLQRSTMGLTPDDVKFSSGYQERANAYKRAQRLHRVAVKCAMMTYGLAAYNKARREWSDARRQARRAS